MTEFVFTHTLQFPRQGLCQSVFTNVCFTPVSSMAVRGSHEGGPVSSHQVLENRSKMRTRSRTKAPAEPSHQPQGPAGVPELLSPASVAQPGNIIGPCGQLAAAGDGLTPHLSIKEKYLAQKLPIGPQLVVQMWHPQMPHLRPGPGSCRTATCPTTISPPDPELFPSPC